MDPFLLSDYPQQAPAAGFYLSTGSVHTLWQVEGVIESCEIAGLDLEGR